MIRSFETKTRMDFYDNVDVWPALEELLAFDDDDDDDWVYINIACKFREEEIVAKTPTYVVIKYEKFSSEKIPLDDRGFMINKESIRIPKANNNSNNQYVYEVWSSSSDLIGIGIVRSQQNFEDEIVRLKNPLIIADNNTPVALIAIAYSKNNRTYRHT